MERRRRGKPMEHLRQLRIERGWSQMAVGLDVDVSTSSIQQYEAGTNYPSVKTLIRLADLFDVSLDYLCDRTEVRSSFNSEEQILVDKLRNVNNKIIKDAITQILNQIVVDR